MQAKLNLHKSEFLPLLDNSIHSIQPIGTALPRTEVFSHLGIPFHPQAFPLPEGWYNQLLEKFHTTATSWGARTLSLAGKVLIVNSRLLSKL